jgi:hypothetical protein
MNEKILQFNNIGTPNYLIKLVNYASKSHLSIKELQDYFLNITIDNRYIFDGGISFLMHLNIFILDDSNKIEINKSFAHFINNEILLVEKINRLFLAKLMESDLFKVMFNKSTMSYEDDGKLVISNAAFKFKYATIRQLLLDFKIISKHPYIVKNFVIMDNYKSYFDNVKISKNTKQKILTLDELKKLQKLKNKYGENAENFVVDFEKSKFKSHLLIEAIEKVSDLNVLLGYDVVSFQSMKSVLIDKFIEVKSYSGKPKFYWSKNEVSAAKEEGDRYFLYLVDQQKIENHEYIPIMIQNPYEEIFLSSEWDKDCQTWLFKKIKNKL